MKNHFKIRLRFIVYLLIAMVWGFYLYLLFVGQSLEMSMRVLGLSDEQALRLCASGIFLSLVIWIIGIAGGFSMRQFATNIADKQMQSGFRRISNGLFWLSGWLPTAVILVFFYVRYPGHLVMNGYAVPALSFLHTLFPVVGLVSIFYGERQIADSSDHLIWLGKRDTHLRTIERQEKVLAERDARSRTILNNMGEGLVLTNTEREITYINPETAKLLKCEREQLVGTKWPETVEMKTLEGAAIPLRQSPILSFIKKSKKTQKDVRLTACDGTTIPVSLMVNRVESEGRPDGYLILFRDLSDQENLDRAKTEFVSLASHQLRTPIAAIRWISELLLEEGVGELTDLQEEYIQKICMSSADMSRMLNDFLQVSNIELGKLEVRSEQVDLRNIVDQSIEENKTDIEIKDLTVKTHYDKDLPKIPLDKRMINLVIENIFLNAVEYSDVGGEIAVTVEGKRKYAYVHVEDEGCGIPEADQNQIFEKFFRASNARTKNPEGTGLGLYLAREMVKRLGGEIWFESEEGSGSVFHVKLPLKGLLAEGE